MRSCSLFARVYVAKSRQRKIEGCHAIAVPCKVGRDVQEEVICHESIRGSDLMLDRISSVMLVHGPQLGVSSILRQARSWNLKLDIHYSCII